MDLEGLLVASEKYLTHLNLGNHGIHWLLKGRSLGATRHGLCGGSGSQGLVSPHLLALLGFLLSMS